MPGLKLNSSGGGSATLDPGSTASNLTFTFPSASGQLVTTGGGDSFSTLTVTGNTYLATLSGNVGIGTSSPATNFQIDKATQNVVRLTSGTAATDLIATASGDGQLRTVGAHPLIFGTNATERMRIDTSGNVGIGTSSPASILDVNGDIQQRNGGGTTIGKVENASGWYSLTADPSNVNGVQISHTTAARFIVNSAERMRIDSSGRVTTPYQPHYAASISCTTSAGYANVWGLISSQGGLTNSGDNVTVPVAGVYMLTWQTICNQSTGRVDTTLRINGTTVTSGLSEDNTTGYHQRTHTIAVKLSANDYISYYNADWYSVGGGAGSWSTISVTLIG